MFIGLKKNHFFLSDLKNLYTYSSQKSVDIIKSAINIWYKKCLPLSHILSNITKPIEAIIKITMIKFASLPILVSVCSKRVFLSVSSTTNSLSPLFLNMFKNFFIRKYGYLILFPIYQTENLKCSDFSIFAETRHSSISFLSSAFVWDNPIKCTNHFCSHHTLFPVSSAVHSTSSKSSFIWNASHNFSQKADSLCIWEIFPLTRIHHCTEAFISAQVFLLCNFIKSHIASSSGLFSKCNGRSSWTREYAWTNSNAKQYFVISNNHQDSSCFSIKDLRVILLRVR